MIICQKRKALASILLIVGDHAVPTPLYLQHMAHILIFTKQAKSCLYSRTLQQKHDSSSIHMPLLSSFFCWQYIAKKIYEKLKVLKFKSLLRFSINQKFDQNLRKFPSFSYIAQVDSQKIEGCFKFLLSYLSFGQI